MTTDFDKYANSYKEIINKSTVITGENFEYFIELRVNLMKEKVNNKTSCLKSMKILDFGCGIGETEIFLRKSFPNAKIFGIDQSVESINTAKKLKLDNVSFSTSESLVLPFEDNYFDLIYSNGTFHHIEHINHLGILKQFNRILKDAGDLFIFENNPYNFLMIRAMKNSPFDKDAKVVYPKNLKKHFNNVGYQLNAVNYYCFFPKWFKFLKFTEKYLRWFPMGAQYFIWGTKSA